MKWRGIPYVFNDFFNRELGESIQAICKYAAKNHRHLNSWLFAVPLAHFLTQESQPFNASVLLLETPRDRDDTWWGAGGFETKAVRDRAVGDDGYGGINLCKVDAHAIIYYFTCHLCFCSNNVEPHHIKKFQKYLCSYSVY